LGITNCAMNNKKWLVPVLVVGGAILLLGIASMVQRARQQSAAENTAKDFLKGIGMSDQAADEIAKNAVNANQSADDPYGTVQNIAISDDNGKKEDAMFNGVLSDIFGGVKVSAYYSKYLLGGTAIEYTVKNKTDAGTANGALADALGKQGFQIMSSGASSGQFSVMASKDKNIYTVTYDQEQQKVMLVVITSEQTTNNPANGGQ
jgi:hypothetical protein